MTGMGWVTKTRLLGLVTGERPKFTQTGTGRKRGLGKLFGDRDLPEPMNRPKSWSGVGGKYLR